MIKQFTKLLCGLVLLIISGATSAQVNAYTFASSSGTYTPVTGGTAIKYGNAITASSVSYATLDDDVYYNRPIGFNFVYNGNTYTSFGFNSNGWLILGSSTTFGSSTTPISSTTATLSNIISAGAFDLFGGIQVGGTVVSGDNFITLNNTSPTTGINVGDSINGTGIPGSGAVVTAITGTTLTIDKNTTSGSTSAGWRARNGEIRYETVGSGTNRTLVLQFTGFARYAVTYAGDRMNFQIRLNETTNTIQVVYDAWSTTYTLTAGSLQVGLKGAAATDYNVRTTTTDWSVSTAGTTNAATMRYNNTVLPSGGLTYTWTPAPPPAIDMAVTALSVPTNACNGSNYPVTVTVRNNGTNPIDFAINNTTVAVSVTGAATQSLTTTLTTGTLAPNATQVVTVAPNANLAAPGSYTLTASVTVTGDGNNTNNSSTATYSSSGLAAIPWSEGFANTTTPAGWSITGWTIGAATGLVGNPGNYIYKNLYSSATTGTFTTLQVGPVAATNELKFDYKVANYGTPYAPPADGWGSFKVQLSTDCGATFIVLDSVFTATAAWVTKTYPLNAYAGQNVIVRIKADWLTGDYNLGFDNFKIETPAACPVPTAIAVGTITATSASVSFTSTGNNFIIEYGATGFTPGTGASAGTGGTVVTGTSSPIVLNGLTAATTYQVYVRQNCTAGANGYSTNSSVVSFTTPALPPANDNASGAITLTVGAGCTGAPYTNVAATLNTGEPYPSCSGVAQTPVWFKFVAPASGAVRVSTDLGTAPTLTDTKVGLFSATDPANYATFSIISCDDDGGSAIGSGFLSVVYATGLTAGTTYYVAVDKYSSTTANGTFCIAVDELSNNMLSLTNTCTRPYQTPINNLNTTYTGWSPLLDSSSLLIALVRNPAGGSVGAYTVSQNVNTGAVRQANGTYYLNRNYRISNTTATNVDVQFFFLNTELAALAAVDPAITLANLGVTRQNNGTSTTCYNDLNLSVGALSFIPQTGNGTAGGTSWISFTTPAFSNFYLNRTGTVLPITLTYLKGMKAGTGNALNWKVNCTSVSITMELERSSDTKNFKAITSITASQARCGQPFDYVDASPLKGTNYYRLKMIDVDGKVSYSPIVAIINGTSGAELVGIYPTVVRDEAFLSVAASRNTKMQINITDMSGRVIKTISQTVANGSTLVNINTAALSAGVYNITGMLDGVQTKTLRFVKQ